MQFSPRRVGLDWMETETIPIFLTTRERLRNKLLYPVFGYKVDVQSCRSEVRHGTRGDSFPISIFQHGVSHATPLL